MDGLKGGLHEGVRRSEPGQKGAGQNEGERGNVKGLNGVEQNEWRGETEWSEWELNVNGGRTE